MAQGAAGVERFGRWTVAVLVTVAAFALPTWLGGECVLPPVLKDGGVRWGVAASLGAVLGALAGLWGYDFTKRAENPNTGTAGASALAHGERSVAVVGDPSGNISTGDVGAPCTPHAPTAGNPPTQPRTAVPPAPGGATAFGDRSIAVIGNPQGRISTGDQASREQTGEGQA